MPKSKPHIEFMPIEMDDGWERPPGYPEGMYQKVLTSNLDEVNKTGSRSRLLRISPGSFSTEPFVHDHWEEVYLVEGDLIVGNDAKGQGGEQFVAPTYACRPPGVLHGPFTSKTGCVMFELHYHPPQIEAGDD
ncbi:MAG: hypothetical protein ACPHGY_09270 [Rhodospirillaceae bacterium]